VTDMNDSNKNETAHGNLLEILDNVIHQLDFTAKLIIVMVVSFITIIPISAIVINSLTDDESLQSITGYIAIVVFLVWLGVGLRQVAVFWKWKRKYRVYKEAHKRLEESLDFEKKDGKKDSSE
jgi:energy-coupling factor transporter transmembrane protein EcfT